MFAKDGGKADLEQFAASTSHLLGQGALKEALEAATQVLASPSLVSRGRLNTTLLHAAMAHYYLGHLSECKKLCGQLYRESQSKAELAKCMRLLILAGETPTTCQGHDLSKHTLQANRGLVLLAAERFTEAISAFQSGPTEVNLLPWMTLCYRRAAETSSQLEYHGLLSHAWNLAAEARKAARKLPLLQPHALRESGIVAAMRGDPGTARRFLERSLQVAQQRGMKLEQAWTHWELARVGASNDWPEARALAETRLKLLEFGALVPGLEVTPSALSLEDQYAALKRAGRDLAAQEEENGIFETLVLAGVKLLNADGIAVLDGDGEILASCGHLKPVPGKSQNEELTIPMDSSRSLWISLTSARGLSETEEGLLSYLVAMASTAIERTQLETRRVEAIRNQQREETRFRELFASSALGLAIKSRKGLESNPRWLELWKRLTQTEQNEILECSSTVCGEVGGLLFCAGERPESQEFVFSLCEMNYQHLDGFITAQAQKRRSLAQDVDRRLRGPLQELHRSIEEGTVARSARQCRSLLEDLSLMMRELDER